MLSLQIDVAALSSHFFPNLLSSLYIFFDHWTWISNSQSNMPKAEYLTFDFKPLILFPFSGNGSGCPGQKTMLIVARLFSYGLYVMSSLSALLPLFIQNLSTPFLPLTATIMHHTATFSW